MLVQHFRLKMHMLGLLVVTAVASAACAAAAVSCAVKEQDKVDCGYVGIQQAECESHSCCWKPAESGPWCYQPPRQDGPTYVLEGKQTQGAHANLTLRLAASVLPQYGPDFNVLTVLVEPQTPQRLHVKIGPVDRGGSSGGSSGTASSGSSGASDIQHGTAATSARWEVPAWLIPRPPAEEFDPTAGLYSVKLPAEGQPFTFSVLQRTTAQEGRQAGQRTIFDTADTQLVFKDQYMEITTQVAASTTLYGLGETINPSGSLALPRDRTITLWNYDVAAYNTGINLYGSHPFLLQLHQDGTASGVFLLNSNGMDVELQGTSVTYRVLGGVLDFYFFLGPSPEAVIQQYHDVIGHPAMPPYWALGFHQCRWGYQTLGDVEEVVSAYSAAQIPLEVIWTDIDYMYHYRDFTVDSERFPTDRFKAFVDRLHAGGQRWVPITDCGIPHAPDDPAYTSGMAQGVFIKDTTGQPYLGQVWPGATHYPDFLSVNRTWPWWKDQLKRLWDMVPYDGMWIDMNEASNFCDGEVCRLPASHGDNDVRLGANDASVSETLVSWWQTVLKSLQAMQQSIWHSTLSRKGEQHQHSIKGPTLQTDCKLRCTPPNPDNKLAFPPYAINNLHNQVPLGSKTLPMTAQHVDGQVQYNTHNLYGLSEAAATRVALKQITGKRPFLLSRSTFPGAGRHTAHWTGDNAATWQDLQWSVQGLLNSNMWALAMAGADICGFQGDTNEELCERWIAAGAFYTFTRNHNTLGAAPQELYRWPTVAAVARKALALRYRLLPHMYTCFYKVHAEGGTVARPLFFEFPADNVARFVSTQWMLGSSIMVAPVLQQGTNQVEVYFPAATWYSLADSSRYTGPGTKTVTVPLTEPPPVFIRGGSIVPLQEAKNTTDAVRQSPVTLVVALDRGREIFKDESVMPQSTSQRRRQGHGQARSCQGCKELQAALLRCARPASSATSARPCDPHSAPAASTDCISAALADAMDSMSGLLLGCGSMYWDNGDSIDVPAHGSVSMLFSFMAEASTQQGWLMLAAEGSDAETGCATACSGHILGSRSTGPARNAGVGYTSGLGQGSRRHVASAGVPFVQDVQVLGVLPPAVGQIFSAWLDGQQVPATQVQYAADKEVLRLNGLKVQLGGVSRLQWGLQPAVVAAE